MNELSARDITKALGGRWCGSYGLARCPAHDDREPSLKIRDDERKLDGIDVHCFASCDWQDVKAELRRQRLLDDFDPQSRPSLKSLAGERNSAPAHQFENSDDAERRVEAALRLWQHSVPLPDTLGWRYFTERRGLHIGTLGDLSHALRWHAGTLAVMGLMTDPSSNEPTGVHRTFLAEDGTKRERKMLGHQGVIRLSPDEDVTLGLGIVEGVEDGLAVLLSGWAPIWVATSAGGIERFPVLVGIEALTIFADDGKAGMEAARACATRWLESGAEAYISPPHRGGGDALRST